MLKKMRQLHEEEVKKLIVKNVELTMQLTSKLFEADDLKTKLEAKQQEFNQMTSQLSDNNLMIERQRKK